MNENSALFIQQTDSLTMYQLNFLHAISDGVNAGLARTDIREQYQLGVYSNVARIKNALVEKELIEIEKGNIIRFADPVFAIWLDKNKRQLL